MGNRNGKKGTLKPDSSVSEEQSSIHSVLPSGSCLICKEGINRRSIVPHLKTCMEKHGRSVEDQPSYLFQISPLCDSRYYLILLIRPEATFIDLDTRLKSILIVDEDRSSRFQFRNQYYFSHMEDGYPGMNVPIRSTPAMNENFIYILYGQRWFPILLTGKIMGELPYSPMGEKLIEMLAVNEDPEEYHRWPQRPKEAIE